MTSVGRASAVLLFLGAVAAVDGKQDATPSPTAAAGASKASKYAIGSEKHAATTSHAAVAAKRVTVQTLSRTSVANMGTEYRAHEIVLTGPAVQIVSVETGDSKVALASPQSLASRERLTVPIKGNQVTVEAKTSVGRAFWTGVGVSGSQPPTATTFSLTLTPGCEIAVESDPPGATVFFNDKQWNHATNTDTIRDPGTWTVRLARKGYADWSATRELGPHDTWRIAATYPPRKTATPQQ